MPSSNPLVHFFAKGSDFTYGAEARDTLFLVGHYGFFMFNLLNTSAILLFQHCVFGRLRKNYLSQLALVACISQMCSCVSSIYRYNIRDEYGFAAHLGNGFGLFAYTFRNIAIMYLFLIHKCRGYFHIGSLKIGYIQIGTIFFVVVGFATFSYTYTNWEQVHFGAFRIYIGLSTAFQAAGTANCAWSLHKEKIDIDQSIISRATLTRLLVLCAVLTACVLLSAATGMTILSYPGSGLSYTTLTIVLFFAGQMDFMQEGYSGVP